jgi:hypothetical protein
MAWIYHSPIEGFLDYFQFEAIKKKAAKSTLA